MPQKVYLQPLRLLKGLINMATPSIDVMDAQQALAGLLGSVIMVLKDPKKRTRAEQVASIIAGTGSAVYLTEPVIEWFFKGDVEPKYLLGFSFLFGVMGLRIIEMISEYVEKKIKSKLGVEDANH